MRDRIVPRDQVLTALHGFIDLSPREGARELLSCLGYVSSKTIAMDGAVSSFLLKVDVDQALSASNSKAQTDKWTSADFVFQLTNDELPMLAQGQKDIFPGETDYHRSIIESFVFLTIGLENKDWSRTELAEITRAVNRLFPMPAIIFFRYGSKLTLAVIPRRLNKHDSTRDVIEPTRKISLIKDVDLKHPHRAHVDIIAGLHIQAGIAKKAPSNFVDLYTAWTELLSAEELNKRFYQRLSDWYLWSVDKVRFPIAETESDLDEKQKLNQISVIRLLTRLIFVWFIKEKGLIPDALFDDKTLKGLLKAAPEAHPHESTYYKAILQNLFFATLNTQMGNERKWRSSQAETGRTPDYGIPTLYRYKDSFADPEKALELFRSVPFLNGGLFECLDREVTDEDLERNPELLKRMVPEGKQNWIRTDGFSERKGNTLEVPNEIFFGNQIPVDLNDEYGTKGPEREVDGLIRIFESFKFTVEENTPYDEEVALDPELLGKVFENLIASYNEDTATTARKKSGSFYTPRVVVDYMVDEALVGYLAPRLAGNLSAEERGLERHKNINEVLDLGPAPGELDLSNSPHVASGEESQDQLFEDRLRALLDYADEAPAFTEPETERLIEAIQQLHAIDPACGSGAFLMGLLQKLNHVLRRLDPDNVRWQAQNEQPHVRALKAARDIPDPARRAERIEDEENALEKLRRDFSNANYPDYARKLYLIDKCIHGVDIQPIAVQIAKLRFFISLVVSQKIDEELENLNITPLPNLETRLVAANSLIPIDRPQQDLFRNPEIEKTERALVEANERYFSARTRSAKNRSRQQIGKLRDQLSKLLTKTQDLPEKVAKTIARWDPFDQNASADFFDPEWMFGLRENFSIVIANPPYIRQEKIDRDEKVWLKARFDDNKKNRRATALYQGFTGTADYLVYFMERGLDLLAPGGAFVFITSNKWYRAGYGKNIRHWMGRTARIRSIIDFGDADVFDAVAYPTIIVAEKRSEIVAAPDQKRDVLLAWNWPSDLDRKDIPEFPHIFRREAFNIPQKALDYEKGWQLEPQIKRELLERIQGAGSRLADFLDERVMRGITTGFNDGFVVNGGQRASLIEQDNNCAKIIKPYLRGKDIEKWKIQSADQWLIKIPSSENANHPWSNLPEDEAEHVFSNIFPSIYNFMHRYRNKLIKRFDKGKYYWELRSCTYWDKFEYGKILSTKISKNPSFCIDDKNYYLGNTAYFFGKNGANNFLLTILNSSISAYLSRYIFATKQNGFYEVQPNGLESFPIPYFRENQLHLIENVDISALALFDPRFEQLFNGLVYELFFPEELHSNGIWLFDACYRLELTQLGRLESDARKKAAVRLLQRHLIPGTPIRVMLSDLQSLDLVRIIERPE